MKNYQKTIVVFGCTGTIGRHVLQNLIPKDCNVRGVLRHPSRQHPISVNGYTNLTYVSANLANPNEVNAACMHADVIFLLTATHPNQVEYEQNVIEAAQKYGIKRIVKLSAPDIQPVELVEVAKWHRTIEAALDRSGIEYCCLRPYAFMQNWERNTFTIRKFGKFFGTMDNAPRNYVDARDVASIATDLLLQEAPLPETAITITGPEAINHYEMAERLSTVTGRTIQYINIPKADLLKNLTKRAKLPLWLAQHIIELDELAVKVPEPASDSTEQYLHKQPRLMNEYLQESKALFAREPVWRVF